MGCKSPVLAAAIIVQLSRQVSMEHSDSTVDVVYNIDHFDQFDDIDIRTHAVSEAVRRADHDAVPIASSKSTGAGDRETTKLKHMESAPSATNVIIVGEANSGTEILLRALAYIENSFPIFEPFLNFQYGRPRLNGTFDSLFSCKFALNGSTLNNVLYPGRPRIILSKAFSFDSNEVPVGFQDWKKSFLYEKNISGTKFSSQIVTRCLQASLKLVSTIRFTGYVRTLPAEVLNHVKVISLIRYPEIAKSLVDQDLDQYNKLKNQCSRIGSGLKSVTNQVNKGNHLVIRFEDLIQKPLVTLQVVLDFLQITPPKDFGSHIESLFRVMNATDHSYSYHTEHFHWPREVVGHCSDLLVAGKYI